MSDDKLPLWLLVLDWISERGTECFCWFGWHLWVYREFLRIPCYGVGHHQCMYCGLVKVRPHAPQKGPE